ncbi:MAG: hypothetical protein ACUZ8H_09230 [Candidatus Anammoxibacter sp.]
MLSKSEPRASSGISIEVTCLLSAMATGIEKASINAFAKNYSIIKKALWKCVESTGQKINYIALLKR